MGNILIILSRVFPLLVLTIYLLTSFYVLGRYNEFYQSNFINRSNSVVGNFYAVISSYKNYFQLREVNVSLAEENARLRKDLMTLDIYRKKLNTDSIIRQDQSLSYLSQYEVIPTTIIHNSVANTRNYIIINKGERDGVRKDMGVVSKDGPVGVVVETSEKYACVMSLINRSMTLSARVLNSQTVGQVKWSGNDIRIAILDEIPKHIKLKKGDEIVTSGFSSYFPSEIPVGKVLYQKEDASNFANIKLQLYNDFSKLNHVYVIKNIEQSSRLQIDSVMREIQNSNKDEQ